MPRISAEVRIRPSRRNVLDVSENKITVGPKIYAFSRVHRGETQASLFSTSILPFLEDGPGPCTILAYGQTGSGKTYTMGLGHSEDGIIQRTLSWAFHNGHSPVCSFIEIYNEEVYDLLENRAPLCLRQGQDGISIVGISEHPIASYEDGLSLLRLGNHCRTTKATKMNFCSSRSHAMFVMDLSFSRFSFIDLAGSERMKRTQCFGSTAKEAISINAGLLALGNVISALYMGRSHIPFRDSKLTRILQSCLVGRVLLLACVSGHVEDAFETSNTLKYASRAATIFLKEKVPESKDGREILLLKKEISALKEENKRLRSSVINSGMSDEKIRSHPLVTELLRRLRLYEVDVTPDMIMSEDKSISESHTAKPLTVTPNIISTGKSHINQPKNKINLSGDLTADQIPENVPNMKGKKRTRLVSFNLEPKSKNSLFTPLKEHKAISFSLIQTIPDQCPISFIHYNDKIVFNSSDSKINIYDNSTSVSIIHSDESIRCIASNEDSLFFTSRSLIKLFSSETKRPFPVYAHKTEITALIIKSNLVFTGHDDGSLCVLDLRSNTLVYSGKIHNGTVFDIAVEGESVYTCSRDHAVKYNVYREGVFDKDFTELGPPHYDSVGRLIFHRGRCVSLGREGAMKVWEDGKPFKTVQFAHEAWIKSGCKGEKWFYTGGKSGDVKCWDFEGGSVRCIGKEDVGSGINCMIEDGNDLVVGTQGRAISRYHIKSFR